MKNKISEWSFVEKFLSKETEEADRLALLEADKVFIGVIYKKGYRGKNLDKKISQALEESSNAQGIMRAREVVFGIKNQLDYNIGSTYEIRDLIENYASAINEILFGDIKEDQRTQWQKYWWPIYYRFFINRRKIRKILIGLLGAIFLILFVADTDSGRDIFNYFVSQIHWIIKWALVVASFSVVLIFLFSVFLVIIEAGYKRKKQKR